VASKARNPKVRQSMSKLPFTMTKLRPLFVCAVILSLAESGLAQGTAYCFGDGSGSSCPCTNPGFPGAGCSSSSFPGAILSAQGTASIASDSLRLRCTLVPFDPSGSAVLFQGATALTAGAPLGAGLLCIGGSVRRLGVKSLAAGLVEFGPALGDPALSLTGGISVPGTTMNYQVWYRDTLAGCAQPAFNLSNGLSVNWGV
jgi:hypothetical protein